MILIANIEPGLLFFLLWGILSWLSRKKTKNKYQDDSGEHSDGIINELNENLFSEINEKFDSKINLDQEKNINKDISNFVKESDNENRLENNHSIYKNKFNIFRTDSLKNYFIIKEILGKPRSIDSYKDNF